MTFKIDITEREVKQILCDKINSEGLISPTVEATPKDIRIGTYSNGGIYVTVTKKE